MHAQQVSHQQVSHRRRACARAGERTRGGGAVRAAPCSAGFAARPLLPPLPSRRLRFPERAGPLPACYDRLHPRVVRLLASTDLRTPISCVAVHVRFYVTYTLGLYRGRQNGSQGPRNPSSYTAYFHKFQCNFDNRQNGISFGTYPKPASLVLRK